MTTKLNLIFVTSFFMLALALASPAQGTQSKVTSSEQKTILITGANRGIGLALAKKFNEEGYNVIATARTPESASKLKNADIRIEKLDISDQKSVTDLAERLRGESIDIVLNNAGIGGHSSTNFEELNIDMLAEVFNVNSLGALRVNQALLPNLRLGEAKLVVSISSRMGSINNNSRGCCYGYRASKGALNNLNKSLSLEFAQEGFTFVVLHPGWVKTDMTSDAATYTPDESAEKLFKVIGSLGPDDNGAFYDHNFNKIPW